MSKLQNATCPQCGTTGSLSIVIKRVTRPSGTHSTTGVQLKVQAQEQPVLCCSYCPYQVIGRFSADRQRTVFDIGST